MGIGKKTYGINFPFLDSNSGDYVDLTTTPSEEVKANLVHLLLTRKGSRYFLPDFGTNLYQYIFENIDDIVMGKIENEIVDACAKYLPNLNINKVNIDKYTHNDEYVNDEKAQHTLTVNIDYEIVSKTFSEKNSVTINI